MVLSARNASERQIGAMLNVDSGGRRPGLSYQLHRWVGPGRISWISVLQFANVSNSGSCCWIKWATKHKALQYGLVYV